MYECALILEEYLRECKDSNKTAYIAFLDAKSAFDVVSHNSLFRKLFNIGIQGKSWFTLRPVQSRTRSATGWNIKRRFL